MARPRVVLLRGHSANPWDLRPWADLTDEFDVRVLVPQRNGFDLESLPLDRVAVRARRDFLPAGRIGDLLVRLPGDSYVGLEEHLQGAAIVHTAEIDPWFAWQPARLKQEIGFRLVSTVWETIPFLDTYRAARGRRMRAETIPSVDLFLAATDRARQCLIVEGVPGHVIRVSYPGIDAAAFRVEDGVDPPRDHVIVSPGRLVWEKGHQDVLRALAALRDGVAGAVECRTARVLIVGAGPEEKRLRRYAVDLGLASLVDFRRKVPYEEMPSVFAQASCMVLASLPTPRWEEQFGMVLAEAMFARTPILASASGAIPEVVGPGVPTFAPGDWVGLARLIARDVLSHPPGRRKDHAPGLLERYDARSASVRLRTAYRELLGP